MEALEKIIEDKYFFNNCWNINHPTVNFFTFQTYCVEVFGHKCIVEDVQDGEIWGDGEYWGSVLYDFENDRYTTFSIYVDKNDIEEILNKWTERNPDNVWRGKISEDFKEDKEKWAINFYKAYLESETNTNMENFYQLMTRKI